MTYLRALGVLIFLLTAGLAAQANADWGTTVAGSNAVVFTFDDGPNYQTTPRLLDLLEHYHVRALFFVNGIRCIGSGETARLNRDVLGEIRKRGHLIGNHTFRHPHLGDLSPRRQRWELLRNEETISRLAGTRPLYYRPPYGRTTSVANRFAAFRGYQSVLWDADARDGFYRSARSVARRILRELERRRGGTVLLHDTHPWSIEAFAMIMDRLNADARKSTSAMHVIDPETALHLRLHPQLQPMFTAGLR